jgi:Fur family ferric uptake transcriptional regulator
MGPPWLHGELRGCGRRLTMPRQSILEILGKTDEHLSAEEIFNLVRKKYPGIGLTTVYRTLELLVSMRYLTRHDFGDGRARYEISGKIRPEDHHHHLVCNECKRVINYKDFIDQEVELLRKTERGLSEKFHFKITDHMIQFYGLCEKCQKTA